MTVLRWLLGGLAAVILAVVGYVAVETVSLGATWSSVERVSLETSPSPPVDLALPDRPEVPLADGLSSMAPTISPPTLPSPSTSSTTTTTTTASSVLDDAESAPSVFALVGSDSREGLDDTTDFGDFAGERADVIILAIRDGDDVGLVSVPRDLYVENLCQGGHHRINAALAGCGDTHGLAHLVEELENVTGLEIDHAALVDLAGFQDVVDAVGGYEICTDYPLRDRKSGLDIDAGCTIADGETTLQWLRSRYTERLVDGSWELVPGVSDLTRNARQRQFFADLLDRQADRNDPQEILDLVEAVTPHMTIDDQLSLTDAASWLWDYRRADVDVAEIPVEYDRTDGGASVLVPDVDVGRFVEQVAP